MKNKETLIQAINIYNAKHRKYKIEYYESVNPAIIIYDKEDSFKVYLGFEYDVTVEEIINILEDLRRELK